MRHSILTLLLTAFLCLAAGCDSGQPPLQKVSLAQKIHPRVIPTPSNALRVAVAAVISPRESFIYYKKLLNYLEERIGRPIRLVQRRTYSEINELLARRELDMAFISSGAYVAGSARGEQQLLAAPVVDGETLYYSYIIVPSASRAGALAELRGTSFAFTDPLSNSGTRAPTAMLARLGATPETFFSTVIFTYSHDRSIEAVSRGLVDGAAVASLVWHYLQRGNPKLTAATRVIEISEPFGMPPVVAPAGPLEPAVLNMKNTLLHLHEEERGRQILIGLMIDRFAEVNDQLYDSVRQLKAAIP